MRIGLIVPLCATLVGLFHQHLSHGAGNSTSPTLLAHVGLSQAYERDGLTAHTCTARRMKPPVHNYLGNTISSIRASFSLGAEIVEFDIHPTVDDRFAVFHDWRLECRTNGHGVTRDHTLAELQVLDIGYGYTLDGVTFPFRGKGTGLMPSLTEVLDAFPNKQLLINIKSRDRLEGE